MAQLRELGKGHGKLEAYSIDPRVIEVRPNFNFRDTSTPEAKKHIAWLAQSIAERGVDQPIWIENTGDKIYLVAGECRLKALQKLWDEGNEVYVPTIAYKGDEAAVLAKSISENSGLPPSILEFGRAAERLQAFGWDAKRIAACLPPHLGLKGKKAEQYVRQAVELQQAPMAVKDAVAHGVEIDGEKMPVSPALAVSATRQSRERAPEIIKEAATKAKAAGKKSAKRPKTEGKQGKAKAAAENRTRTIEKIGDLMAEEILRDKFDVDKLEELAREWQSARILQ
ncbi:MAG: ParB/RepB/Spo0J family partition protein [Terriglobia bacterium]